MFLFYYFKKFLIGVNCFTTLCWFLSYNKLNQLSVQSLSRVQLFVTPWTTACQAFLSVTNSWSLLTSIELVMPSKISSSFIPFSSCLQSFPASGSFPMSQFFASGGQSTGASTSSVLPMNIQDWFSLQLTGLIFLQSRGLSRVFSHTTVQKHQFFGVQPSLWSNSHNLHNYWESYSFDYMDLCWQSNVSAF